MKRGNVLWGWIRNSGFLSSLRIGLRLQFDDDSFLSRGGRQGRAGVLEEVLAYRYGVHGLRRVTHSQFILFLPHLSVWLTCVLLGIARQKLRQEEEPVGQQNYSNNPGGGLIRHIPRNPLLTKMDILFSALSSHLIVHRWLVWSREEYKEDLLPDYQFRIDF